MKPLLLFSLVFLALAPVAAPLLAADHPLAALLIRDFFSRLCHQDPARSFLIAGAPAAVCVRCLGMYCGAAAAALTPVFAGSRRALALSLLLNLLDVATEVLHGHGSLPLPRFCFGLLLGWSAGALLVSARRKFTPPGRLPCLRR